LRCMSGGHGARKARHRVSSANGDHLLDQRVIDEMQAYSLAARGRAAADCTHATSQTVEAARAVLRWFNHTLAAQASGPVEAIEAYELTNQRDWALHALIAHGAMKFAKKEQLEATGGKPLAVCTGGGSRIPVDTALGWLQTSTKGCFRVFEEPQNLAGKKWARLCPDCQKRGGRRDPYRDARRELRRRVSALRDA